MSIYTKGVSFQNRNQLYPLIILHVQCGLCVQYVYLHKRTYHFQIEINYILLSSCTSNVVCVYSMFIYTKGTYHFQIEINYIILSSSTSNVVCVYSISFYTKGRIIPKYKSNISSHHPARSSIVEEQTPHDDVITGKRLPHYWPVVRGNSLVTSGFPAQRASDAAI